MTGIAGETVEEPVLIMAFNRPDHLHRLVDRLREVQPRRIFVAMDGPRAHVPGESERVQQCRDEIDRIDWPCSIEKLYQSENLGCGRGVSTAVTWFFQHVERGIILEDDIIPVPSFFPFCSELLTRYADDPRVFAISGCNFVPPSDQSRPDLPYRFSQVPHIWGWATWRRTWERYTWDIAGWPARLPLTRLWTRSGHSLSGAVYWGSTFELLARKQVDTWDGQLVLLSMIQGQWTATSNANLIENIGFGADATHTHEDRNDLQPLGRVSLPLADVPVELDSRADRWTRRHHFHSDWRGIFRQAQTYLRHRGRQVT